MNLKETLKLAWENKGDIAEGFYNTYISLDSQMKEEAQRRKTICESNVCGYYDVEGKPETSAIPGKPACSACHCNIGLSVHTMEKTCGLEKVDKEPLWFAVTTNDQEKEIQKKKYYKQFEKK